MNWKDVNSSGRLLFYGLKEPTKTTKSHDDYETGGLNTGEWHKWTAQQVDMINLHLKLCTLSA
jgi:hypothetical protein